MKAPNGEEYESSIAGVSVDRLMEMEANSHAEMRTRTSALSASNLEAIAYHLEQGRDNGGIERASLARQLRSVAKSLRSAASERDAEVARAVADTIEMCAKIADRHADDISGPFVIMSVDECEVATNAASSVAAAIRARGERKE